ncbi:unnamed protein product [Alopecurus aequalis]
MAGEEGSSKERTTRSKTMTAAEAAVSGGTTKREAEESLCPTRSKAAGIGCSELKQGAAPVKGEGAAGKRMTRLPQEEINSILETVMDDDRLPPDYRALKRHSPDLIPSPEEATDEELVSFYDVVREFYAVGEEFREFQAWVRDEYAKNGYVEVDDEFLAKRAEGQAVIEEARKEALKGFDFSDLID